MRVLQFKEMGGKDSFRSNSSDSGKLAEQTNEKKKGLGDWMNMIKPGNEEKDHWVRLPHIHFYQSHYVEFYCWFLLS